jgi:redox-sensing transcriptional repressor
VRAAQDVADLLVAAGVRGILNFAPRKLRVPESVALRTVDMAVEFESLSFELSRERTARRRKARD